MFFFILIWRNFPLLVDFFWVFAPLSLIQPWWGFILSFLLSTYCTLHFTTKSICKKTQMTKSLYLWMHVLSRWVWLQDSLCFLALLLQANIKKWSSSRGKCVSAFKVTWGTICRERSKNRSLTSLFLNYSSCCGQQFTLQLTVGVSILLICLWHAAFVRLSTF